MLIGIAGARPVAEETHTYEGYRVVNRYTEQDSRKCQIAIEPLALTIGSR